MSAPSRRAAATVATAIGVPPRARILLISDEPPTLDSLAALLVRKGGLVFQLSHTPDPLYQVIGIQPDLIVVEIAAAAGDQNCWHQRLRRRGVRTPLLVVSPSHSLADRVQGLELGADDFLVKPFHPAELVARVQALLRRGAKGAIPATRLRFGVVLVDLERSAAMRPTGETRLSRIECALLHLLAQAHGRPVSRIQMRGAIWASRPPPALRSIDVHISRLRRKLGDLGHASHWIESVPRIGYRLGVASPATGAASAA